MDSLAILIFWGLIGTIVGGMIGQTRGCSGFGLLLGFLLGPLGWLITALNDRRPVCPECKGRYPEGARRCLHCGAEFAVASVKAGSAWQQARTTGNWQQTVAAEDDVAKWAGQNSPPTKSSPLSTEIHFECPKCQQRISGHEVLQFREVDCPGCGEKFKPVPLPI